MHVHVGALDFVKVACYIVIFEFIWNWLSMKFSESVWGQAMSVMM